MKNAKKPVNKKLSKEQLLSDNNIEDQGLPMLHTEMQRKVLSACRGVVDLVPEAFQIAQEFIGPNGSISLQGAASLANILAPIIQISRIVEQTNMDKMYDSLEEILKQNGVQKSPVKDGVIDVK